VQDRQLSHQFNLHNFI